MNNSTEEQDETGIEQSVVVFLDKTITKKEWFRPIAGVVEHGSVMEQELLKMLEAVLIRKREIKALAGLALSA
jgi:hypothetical protein